MSSLFGGAKQPEAPPPVLPPTDAQAAPKAASVVKRTKNRGQGQTILTSELGVDTSELGSRKTLGGGMATA